MKNYDDIIHLPHHVSKVHPRMSMSDRAAQFSPFAALTGHEQAILETARQVEKKIELDESQKSLINRQLHDLKIQLPASPEITVVYFQKDEKKDGGHYLKVRGRVKNIDDHKIVLDNEIKIVFEDIFSLDDI